MVRITLITVGSLKEAYLRDAVAAVALTVAYLKGSNQ